MKIVLTRPLLFVGALSIALGCSSDRSLPTDLSTGGENSPPTGIVPAGAPANVAITPSPVPQLGVGDSVMLSSLVTTSTGQQLNPALLWTSSDTAVATVNPLGVVLARNPGTAVVRGTVIASASSTVTGSVVVTVLPPTVIDSIVHTAAVVASVKSIVVGFGHMTIGTGGTVQALTLVKDSLGQVLTGRTVTWTSGTPSVATIDATTGLITGIAAGTSMIIATSGTVTGSAPMTVTSTTVPVASVKAVTVALSSTSVLPAATSQATATLKDSLGNVLTGRAINWTSSTASVATINTATGVVTGVAAGTSVVTATSGSASGSTTITVTTPPVVVVPVKTISVTLSGSNIAPAATAQATATLKDSLGKVLTGRTVTWTSTSPTTATVHATAGVITGIAAGTTTITATSGSVTGSATITVVAAAPPPPPTPTMGARLANGPTSFINSAYVAPAASAHIYHVGAGQSLQTRIDSAAPGDVILLAAGATFTGPFLLKPKTGGVAPIIIRSDTPDAQLPAEGTRITPAASPILPHLVATTANLFVITTVPRAANYRLMFLDVAPVTGNDLNTLVRIGSSNGDQPVLDSVPSNIILDRVYLHGLPTNNLVRCVQIHGQNIAIVDSYLSEAHANGQDSQAIVGWNGPGPYKIVNNFLSAAGENVMFGGSDPLIPGMIASDIVMQRNYVWKDPAWKGSIWTVKNHLEFKVGQRALIEGNIFENNWVAGQTGLSILIKSTNQSGGFTGAVSRDIIFRSNIIRNAVSGMTIASRPDGPALAANLITVQNNLFEQLSSGTTLGIGFRLNSDVKNIVFQNNTLLFAPGSGLTTVQMDRGTGPGSDSVAIMNNVMSKGTYGVFGLDGAGGEGANSLATYHASWLGNVLNGVSSPQYPSTGGNTYPSAITLVYPSWQSSSYSITTAFHNAGSNGRDPGADMASLLAATAGVK